MGTTPGTNNNMPAGLTDTATSTTASPAPAGTRDQIAHTDVNVTARDCNFCHTQVGSSTMAGVVNVEWTKATFHRNFTSANPLTLNGTTGRCSNCHLNVKPGAAYTQQAHAGFTATSTQDCSSCHSWPGTSPSTPNWLGATGAHAASGSTVTSALDCNTCHGQGGSSQKHLLVPAANHYGGITNGNKCTSCHIDFTGFKGTITNLKYGHTNATANAAGCVTCHAFSSSLYTTLTNTPGLTHPTAAGGHQFSQTFSVTGVRANCGDTNPNGCFTSNHANTGLARCSSCHKYVATTAGTDVWPFVHDASNPGVSSTRSSPGCTMCH
jgi:ubiquitin